MEADKLKVLIVDDDLQFLETMKHNLESKNCFVQCASNKLTAQSLLINEIFHVVFIDCVLNSGEGTELIQEIKKTIGNSVEIIMMSGIVPEKSLSSYIDLGICDFFSKPISDKEIEESLNHIKEKYIEGNKKNILAKLFSSNNSDIRNLKFLISLKKAKDYEFFLYLNQALSSKESISLEFQLNNKRHKVVCNKGTITDYECDKTETFLDRLFSRNFITRQEFGQLRALSQKEAVQTLLKECILSAGQIIDIKYDMLIETLKEIIPGIQISLNINLVPSAQESFLLLSRDEYADLIFLFLKQKFNNQLFSLFDEDIMKRNLVFKDNLPHYLPEIESFLNDLKSGMKLKGIYNKYINDKNSFCSYLFYVLLKGNVHLSETSANVKYHYLYERYKNLYQIMNKTKKPEELFAHFCAIPEVSAITPQEIKGAYLRFIKHNHPDVIPFNIPKDLIDLINKILTKMKSLYDLCCDPILKRQEDQKMKKKILEDEILLTEKKKICERNLEDREYIKAISLIESVPQKAFEKETHWQLLYLWLYFKKNDKANTKTAHKYMKNIQAKARDLQKDKLFHYILGLYHESKHNYEQAKICFEKTKSLEPSFQPCYPAIKKCSLHLLEQKQANQPLFSTLNFFSLSNLRKKKSKKAS